jgi:hypothetical protein
LLLAARTASLTALLLVVPAAAHAGVHTFSPLSDDARTATFKLAGLDPAAIVDARLAQRRVSVAKVRRAARSRGRLVRLRVPARTTRRVAVLASTKSTSLKVTTAPETTITRGWADGSQTTDTTATFSFSSSAPRSTFQCSLDGASATRCSSGIGHSALAPGTHRFSVYAVDRHGTPDQTPAVRTWTVLAPPQEAPSEPARSEPAPSEPAPAEPVHAVPSSVPSGCSADATGAMLAWIATVPDGATLRLGSGACYRIEGTLELGGRRIALDGNGATLRSFNAPADHRAIWRLWNSEVAMRDLTITGSYAGGGVHDAGLQHAHAIDLRGTKATIERVAMSDVAGDCLYFGLGGGRSSGTVRDSSCRRIGRNGVSVTAGDDIRVERVTTDRIGYIVFDVEPNTGTGFGSQRVVFDSNTIGTYYMKAYTIIGNAPVSEQSFTNNRVVGDSLRVGVVDRSHRPSGVTISGNASDTAAPNNALTLYGVTGLKVTQNTVPLNVGTMAYVSGGCNVAISGNAYPGGSREAFITDPMC